MPTGFAIQTRTLPEPRLIGALMLGAALALLPLAGMAQTAAPETAPADAATAAPAAPADAAATPAAPAAPATAPADAAAAPAAGAPAGTTTEATADTAQAAAVLKSADGTEHGSVTLSDTPSGSLHVILHLEALPDGPHAIHIHETGKCEGPKFESAGGHLAGDKKHGALHPEGLHKGDLPNIDAADGGPVTQEFFVPGVTLADVMDDDGGSFIVHAGTDDYVSQPAGNAGDRIACGVFEATAATN